MDVRWPLRSPEELDELLLFLDRLEEQMRRMRDDTALPRDAVTLPDELDGAVADLTTLVREQVDRARRDGQSAVEVTLPLTEPLVALARWSKPRMDLLSSLTRAGLVQPDWERPLKLLIEVWETVLGQLPE